MRAVTIAAFQPESDNKFTTTAGAGGCGPLTMILFNYTTNRDNNFKLVAFCCALTVLFSHSFPLSGGPANILLFVPELGMTYGSIAVDILFIISGFFITRGFLNRRSSWQFLRSRLLRIYPGMLVATLFCVLVIGLVFTTRELSAYLFDEQTLKFIKRNTLLYSSVKFFLPEVFQGNPYSPAVVGSVWTLPYQLKAYMLLMVSVLLFQRFVGDIEQGVPRLIYIGLASGLIGLNIVDRIVNVVDADYLRLFAMFFTGSSCYLLRDRILLSYRRMGFVLLALFISYYLHTGLFYLVYALGIAYILMCIAYLPGGWVRRFNRQGDYSYGIYIYGFTMQQSIMAVAGELTPVQLFGYAAIATLSMAFLSWHLVEKQALKLK